MKAILLVRVSSDTQSLDEQTTQLFAYAKELGYKDKDIITIEDTESAIKLSEFERKGLNNMKNFISTDKSINAVFLWELSRLTRKSKDAFSLRDYFLENKIQLYCYSPKFQLLKEDLSDLDDNGSLLFALWVQMAEGEMRNKKARFHRSKIRNAKTGKYSGGFVKYGYDVDENGYYKINEKQAEFIRYIFDRYEHGISILKLTKELQQRGLINTQYFVQGVLNSDCYTGSTNKYGLNRIYPQIISTEQFERCKEIKRTNNRKLDKAIEVYYCKGLIKCTVCNKYYIGMKVSGAYVCYGRIGKEAKYDGNKKCSVTTGISINALDSLIWDICKEREIFNIKAENVGNITKFESEITVNQEKINNSVAQINKIEIKRERNNTMYFNGQINEIKYKENAKVIDDSIKEYNNTITNSTNIINQLNSKIKALKEKATLINIYNNKSDYLDNLSDDKEKQTIVKEHVKEINVSTESNKIKVINITYTDDTKEQYRYFYRAIPQNFEYNSTFKYGGMLKAVWQHYQLDIIKRFGSK